MPETEKSALGKLRRHPVRGRSLVNQNTNSPVNPGVLNMKTAASLVIALVLSVSAHAKTLEQAYIESYQSHGASPAPVEVVSPNVSGYFVGTSVELSFIVDEKGLPTHITTVEKTDPALAETLVSAVGQWKFSPALRDGKPVATKVLLPIRIEAAKPASLFVAD